MRWKFFIALVIIILAGGGGAGWYFFLREAAPEVVLQKMQQAMFEVRSLHSETAFSANIDMSKLSLWESNELPPFSLPNERELTLHMLITGDHAVDAEGLPMMSQANIALYTSPKPSVRLAGELRTIEKITYFKLDDIGWLLPIDFSAVKGEWYRADDLQKFAALEKQREEITGEPQKNQWANTAKAIREISTRAMLFDVLEVLPEEKLDGVATRHYRVKFNIPETRTHLENIFETMNFNLNEDGRTLFDRLLVEAENARGELWIGKRNSLLYRSTIAWPFHYEFPENQGSIDINVSLTAKNSKFNESVTVTAPPDAHDQQEFMQKLFGGFLGNLGGLPAGSNHERSSVSTSESETASDAAWREEQNALGNADGDTDGLVDAQEKFWGSDPKNSDTDGDGYADGAEVDNGYSPIGPGKLF